MWSAQAKAKRLTLLVADNKTGYFGVHLPNPGRFKPYAAQVTRGGKQVHLGCFATAEEAALCVARSLEGEKQQSTLENEDVAEQVKEEVKEEVPDWPEPATRIEESTDGDPVYILDLDDEALVVRLKRVAAALSQPATATPTVVSPAQPAALAPAAPPASPPRRRVSKAVWTGGRRHRQDCVHASGLHEHASGPRHRHP